MPYWHKIGIEEDMNKMNKSEWALLSNMMDTEAVDMIPLITPEEEAEMDKEEFPSILPILPVRNIV